MKVYKIVKFESNHINFTVNVLFALKTFNLNQNTLFKWKTHILH